MQLHGTLKQMVHPHMWDIHIVQTSWHLHLKNILWISMLDHLIYFEHIFLPLNMCFIMSLYMLQDVLSYHCLQSCLLASSYKLLEHHINVTYNCTIEYDTKCNTQYLIYGVIIHVLIIEVDSNSMIYVWMKAHFGDPFRTLFNSLLKVYFV